MDRGFTVTVVLTLPPGTVAVTVSAVAVVTEPGFRSAKTLDERWIELWESALGTHGTVVDPVDDGPGCAAVADLWTGTGGSAQQAEVIIGKSRSDEMGLVARRIEALLAGGAENIAVVFPKADVAHVLLARELTERAVVFADLLESSGSPSIDLQLHRSLVGFYAQAGRLEDLLELWPLLRSLNLVTATAAQVRRVCEELFDDFQVHGLEVCQPGFEKEEKREKPREEWKEVARIAAILLPVWPEEIAFADALARFRDVCAKLGLEPPSEWVALEQFGVRQDAVFPRAIVLRALAESLPQRVPATAAAGKGRFARVTLTTRRRALGVAWSHLILTESNAGVWPVRVESSGWLADERRRSINASSPYSLGVMTSDDRAEIERQGYLHLAGDTRHRLIFSAALGEDEDPELPLSPNAWLERILLSGGLTARGGIERVFSGLARTVARRTPKVAPAAAWRDIWLSRRDPQVLFDRFFFSDPAEASRPTRLAARLFEQAVADPAVLWFNAILHVQRVEWRPLTRSYARSLGQFAHDLLAEALEGPPAEDVFREMPKAEVARAKLELSLQTLRHESPKNRYWDSFLGELSGLTRELIDQVYTLKSANFVAAEKSLPRHATIPLGPQASIGVSGRMDLVILDRPRWTGATVAIIDFKTGADARMSAKKMGSSGSSLQLGVYLAATRSLGIAEGSVWMLKPGSRPESVSLEELDTALEQLGRIEVHLRTGIYGALTKDRTEFSRGFEWPLACAPIKHAILKEKFAATFGVGGAAALEEDLYE